MGRSKESIDSFRATSEDIVLVDTNILIKWFYSFDFSEKSDKYERLYQELLKAKSHLIISSIQVSEFINKCIRIQYKLYCDNHPGEEIDYKKDYRNTEDYREKMTGILDIIKTDIAPIFEFINDEFDQMESGKIFIYGFSYDFNDALIAEIARKRKAVLVTHDADFANYGSGFRIVTDNKKLLMFR